MSTTKYHPIQSCEAFLGDFADHISRAGEPHIALVTNFLNHPMPNSVERFCLQGSQGFSCQISGAELITFPNIVRAVHEWNAMGRENLTVVPAPASYEGLVHREVSILSCERRGVDRWHIVAPEEYWTITDVASDNYLCDRVTVPVPLLACCHVSGQPHTYHLVAPTGERFTGTLRNRGDQVDYIIEEKTMQNTTSPKGELPIAITAELGEVQLTLQELAALRPGDSIRLPDLRGISVTLRTNGETWGTGELYEIDGAFSLRFLRLVSDHTAG